VFCIFFSTRKKILRRNCPKFMKRVNNSWIRWSGVQCNRGNVIAADAGLKVCDVLFAKFFSSWTFSGSERRGERPIYVPPTRGGHRGRRGRARFVQNRFLVLYILKLVDCRIFISTLIFIFFSLRRWPLQWAAIAWWKSGVGKADNGQRRIGACCRSCL
jgi:hypothetical protein